ncbi:MAG: hypothetical protein LBE49_08345, partial [Deltaproteobacteria bacterium]|nr:hypothetical protein [Deltaproteobacteria bacterium]
MTLKPSRLMPVTAAFIALAALAFFGCTPGGVSEEKASPKVSSISPARGRAKEAASKKEPGKARAGESQAKGPSGGRGQNDEGEGGFGRLSSGGYFLGSSQGPLSSQALSPSPAAKPSPDSSSYASLGPQGCVQDKGGAWALEDSQRESELFVSAEPREGQAWGRFSLKLAFKRKGRALAGAKVAFLPDPAWPNLRSAVRRLDGKGQLLVRGLEAADSGLLRMTVEGGEEAVILKMREPSYKLQAVSLERGPGSLFEAKALLLGPNGLPAGPGVSVRFGERGESVTDESSMVTVASLSRGDLEKPLRAVVKGRHPSGFWPGRLCGQPGDGQLAASGYGEAPSGEALGGESLGGRDGQREAPYPGPRESLFGKREGGFGSAADRASSGIEILDLGLEIASRGGIISSAREDYNRPGAGREGRAVSSDSPFEAAGAAMANRGLEAAEKQLRDKLGFLGRIEMGASFSSKGRLSGSATLLSPLYDRESAL